MGTQSDMQVFATVVLKGGFSAAARELGITRSSTCRRVEKLEERLGVRLLNRTTRRIDLTEAGDAYYRRCQRILSDIAEAEEIAGQFGHEARGTLRW